MKLYRSVWIQQQGFPTELYEAIVRLKPECLENDHFRLECEPGDTEAAELAQRIVALCDQHGLRQTSGEPGTYGYGVVRQYEPADFETVAFLLLETQRKMFRNAMERDESGRLLIPAVQAKPTVKMASIYPSHLVVVSDAVRGILECGGLIGLQFKEATLKGKSGTAASRPFWEMKSSLTLPRMTNSVLREGRPFVCYGIAEPPYRAGEPHYRQKDLKSLGNFDIAHTFEPLGQPHPGLIYLTTVLSALPFE